jgi:hypothetical protein
MQHREGAMNHSESFRSEHSAAARSRAKKFCTGKCPESGAFSFPVLGTSIRTNRLAVD